MTLPQLSMLDLYTHRAEPADAELPVLRVGWLRDAGQFEGRWPIAVGPDPARGAAQRADGVGHRAGVPGNSWGAGA